MPNSNLQLTISLLISDRLDTIPRCLDSLRPILEAIPSELILIDTSKNPKVNALLKTYTDKVHEFEWCNDFAKARNEGVRRAKGEWYMFLDDDEWFVETQPIIDFFQSGEYKGYNLAHYQIRNFENIEYTIYTDCWVSRMAKLDSDTRFVGRIHEYFGNVQGREKYIEAMAYHSGYIFDTEEKRLARAGRNIPLIEEMLKEEPDNVRWMVQLIQEKRSLREWEWVEEYTKAALEKKFNMTDREVQIHFATFYSALIETLMFQGKHEECLVWCEKALQDIRSTELLKAQVYNRMAENTLVLRDWEKAADYARKYLAEYERLSKNDEIIREQMRALLVRHAFDNITLQKAYGLLVFEDMKKGSTKMLHEYYEKLAWGSIFNFITDMLARLLVELLAQGKKDSILVQALNDACQNEQLRTVVCAEAQNVEEENPEQFQALVSVYAKVESEFWYIWYMKLLYADMQRNHKAVEKAIIGLLHAIANVFYLTDVVYQIAEKYKIVLPLLWEKVAKEDWERQLMVYVLEVDDAHLSNTQKLMHAAYRPDSQALQILHRAILEKHILSGPRAIQNLEEYYVLLKNYFGLEEKDKLQDLTRLKEAVAEHPEFAEGIGTFIRLYSEFERQRAEKQRKEMETLRIQVIDQVKGMVASGQTQAALQILGQLKQMFPEDLEVATLALEVRLES